MNNVIIYTDGAARGNPNGPGGYGVVLEYTDKNGIVWETMPFKLFGKDKRHAKAPRLHERLQERVVFSASFQAARSHL